MLVQTRNQFNAALDVLGKATRIAVDTETNGLYPYKGHRLCGVAVYVELDATYDIGIYFPFRHAIGETLFNVSQNLPIEWLAEIGAVLARPDLTTIWHNWKFDAKMLRADGIEIGGPIYCTQQMSVLADENGKHSLEAVEAKYLGTTTKRDTSEKHLRPYLKGKKDYSKVPPKDMEFYACNDVRVTQRCWYPLIEDLKEQEQWPLWSDVEAHLHQLFEMEWAGIPVDQTLAQRLSSEAEARMRELEDEMGFDPQKLAILADNLFAQPPAGAGLRIPSRVTKHTSALFPYGLPGMDNEELLGLIDHDPTCDEESRRSNRLVSNVLEYRGLVKANSTWYRGFIQHSDSQGCIHPTYNTNGDRDKYGTVTSRLSCAEPNIQQLPRDPARAVYKLLIPNKPRWRLWVADYSQIEYRLGSVYADETIVLEAYRRGQDVHQVVADRLGIPRNHPQGGVDGKKVNFTCYYGASGKTVATLLKLPEAEGIRIQAEYWKGLPKTRKFTFQCSRIAKERGYIKLWNGRRRRFVNEYDAHKAFNSLIQGGAAQIMERTMVMLYRRRAIYRTIMQIHDALGFMVPIEFETEFLAEIREIMEWPTTEFPIAFPVEFKSIHDASEEETDCTPTYYSDMDGLILEPPQASLSMQETA